MVSGIHGHPQNFQAVTYTLGQIASTSSALTTIDERKLPLFVRWLSTVLSYAEKQTQADGP